MQTRWKQGRMRWGLGTGSLGEDSSRARVSLSLAPLCDVLDRAAKRKNAQRGDDEGRLHVCTYMHAHTRGCTWMQIDAQCHFTCGYM